MVKYLKFIILCNFMISSTNHFFPKYSNHISSIKSFRFRRSHGTIYSSFFTHLIMQFDRIYKIYDFPIIKITFLLLFNVYHVTFKK